MDMSRDITDPLSLMYPVQLVVVGLVAHIPIISFTYRLEGKFTSFPQQHFQDCGVNTLPSLNSRSSSEQTFSGRLKRLRLLKQKRTLQPPFLKIPKHRPSSYLHGTVQRGHMRSAPTCPDTSGKSFGLNQWAPPEVWLISPPRLQTLLLLPGGVCQCSLDVQAVHSASAWLNPRQDRVQPCCRTKCWSELN